MHWGEMARKGGVPPETPRRCGGCYGENEAFVKQTSCSSCLPASVLQRTAPTCPVEQVYKDFVGVAAAWATDACAEACGTCRRHCGGLTDYLA